MHSLDHHNRDPVTATTEIYDMIAKSHSSYWFDSKSVQPYLDDFVSHLSLPGEVLDAGCGPGRDVSYLTGLGIETVGIDVSTSMIDEACCRSPTDIFRHMDMRRPRFPSELFAGVWSCASLQHLPQDDSSIALREWARILRPKGVLGLSIENGLSTGYDQLGRFMQQYSLHNIRQIVVNAGFEIVSVKHSRTDRHCSGQASRRDWTHIIARKITTTNLQYVPEFEVTSCLFCPDSRFELNRQFGLLAASSVLWSDRHLYVVPDIAPIVEGHLLVTSVNHRNCYGACLKDELDSLVSIRDHIRRLFKRAYGTPTLFFEHGAHTLNMAGTCIDHAHLHCIPGNFNLREILNRKLGAGMPTEPKMLQTMYRSGQSYLYVEDSDGTMTSWPVNILPCQYLRQVLVSILGRNDWRWQDQCSVRQNGQLYRDTVTRLVSDFDKLGYNG